MLKKLSSRNIMMLAILIAGTLFFNSCNKDKKKTIKKVDIAFATYINGFTSGIISNSDPIIIEFAEKQNTNKDNISPFKFNPEIKGKAYWKDEYTIEFVPDETLPNGQFYEASFDLSKIMKVPEKYQKFNFDFKVKTQSIDVRLEGMEAYNSNNLEWNKFEGVISTSDNVKHDDIEKIISAKQKSKTKRIKWLHIDKSYKHFFTIDSIHRGDKESKLVIKWNGKPILAKQKNEEIVKIPSINSFSVMNISVNSEPSQKIRIYFSDPIDSKQNLRGLIHFKNNRKIKLLIDENMVSVYPTGRIVKEETIIVEPGIKNTMGVKIKKPFSKKIIFRSLKPNIKAITKGVILPNSNGLVYPFSAVNLKAVNVKIIKIFENKVSQFLQVNQFDGKREIARVGRIIYDKEVVLKSDKDIDYGSWNTFALDLNKMINVDPGAVYRIEMSFNKNQSLFACSDKITKIISPDENQTEINNNKYDGPRGNNYYYYYDDDSEYYYNDYRYRDRDNPCKNSYYYSRKRRIKQNILASNFGIIAKEDDDHTINVYITDLITTEKLQGVEIEIYNYQHQLLSKTKTNKEGHATIKLDGKPFLLVAKQSNQYGYLRLDNGSSLSLSMFNVSGQKLKKGVKGFIYAERGVWRPGDSIYLNFILEDKNNKLPKKHPVVLEIFTPDNQLFKRKINNKPVQNFYDFRFATSEDAPTGNWMAKIKVGGSTFTKNLKIETIKPNRLKINLDFGGKILHSTNKKINLESRWLHGATASDLKSVVEMKLSQGKTVFKNYEKYTFDDISKTIDADIETIFDGKLNNEGKANIPINISINNAPGMVKAGFTTRVFEKGGSFSIDHYSIPYSPYKYYVGVKIPKGKGWNNALYSDEPNLIPIVTLDEFGKPVSRNNIKIEVYEISWRWWWQRSTDSDLGHYIRSKSSKIIVSDNISTKKGKAIYKLEFPYNSWGRKYIKITDLDSGHSTGKIFYTDYKSWWDDPDNAAPGGAEMLSFSTNKTKYNVGDEVQINIPKSQEGKVLVSIENGTKVVKSFWSEVSKTKQKINFTASAEMTPNVYIHLSYIQPHAQSENDRPIRLYGVQGINVENVNSRLNPVIEMKDELHPEKETTIHISEKDGKEMTYTIAVVDDGLLDLTRFKTPNPWNTFYAKEALGVKTYDLYNYVIGAFSGKIAGLLAVGGDEDLIKKGNKKANRFKPVVMIFGPYKLKKGENAKHTFTMPNYIGSVRTMVVAGSLEAAYGFAEKTTQVKKPLMVLATLPRVLGPQENVKLPVTVFAMKKNIKDVKVRVIANDILKINDQDTKTIHFDKEGDQIVNFDLQVARKVGIGKIKVEVSGNGEKATTEIELNVRIANPEITKIKEAVVEKNSSWKEVYTPLGIIGTNKAILEVSTIPPINLGERLDYLIRYPHGCIEQTTSSVFPQLYLGNIMDLSNAKKAKIQDNISQALIQLKKFQISSGGFTYWPGHGGHASDWGTNYAGHFILEAQKKGYSIPDRLLENWIKFQKNRANNWSTKRSTDHYNRSSDMIQAYRLFTLALAGKPAIGAMNRMREITDLYAPARWRLIMAYWLSGKQSTAKLMMKNLPTEVKKYNELGYSYGSNERDEAMILEALISMNELSKAKKLLDKVAENLSSERWMSTQTTAYSLLAVSKFVDKQSKENMKFNVSYSGGNQKINTNKPMSQIALKFASSGASNVRIENKSEKILFVRLINNGIPLESNDIAFNKNIDMKIKYFNVKGKPINPKTLKQGTDFVIEVSLTHKGIMSSYKNMALTQIFPSGWEITNPRMDNISRWPSDPSTYMDIRDDRVLTYFDLKKYKTITYRIMANASYLGEYYLPSFKCEAMYDNSIMAISNGMWVKVVK